MSQFWEPLFPDLVLQPQAQLPSARGSSAVLSPPALAPGARAEQGLAHGPTPPQATGRLTPPDSWLGPYGFWPLISVTRWLFCFALGGLGDFPLALASVALLRPSPRELWGIGPGRRKAWRWSAPCSPGAFLGGVQEHGGSCSPSGFYRPCGLSSVTVLHQSPLISSLAETVREQRALGVEGPAGASACSQVAPRPIAGCKFKGTGA